jgi:multidrug transporter EmrE-like cation transporter
LDWHVGKFGPIDFKIIYPILNGFGLLMLVVTGVMMWFQMRPRKRNTPS